jgi:hypothetical protein
VSLSSSSTHGKWTIRDQVTAEVAAACGVKYAAIGQVLGYHPQTVRRHLIATVAERKREIARNYYQLNPDVQRNASLRWHQANPGLQEEYNRRYYESNREKVLERQRISYQKRKLEKAQQSKKSGQ